ncbi:MAG: hypothetical protein CL840_07145 [Crocinitomicaceae bacterium]|nr:hypothetical protein [Crocinitomicaceae bacterium]|tara:strand:- start:18615 stop:20369 length:1755 start_codon:yes stop_codon:yes gene_type:complete
MKIKSIIFLLSLFVGISGYSQTATSGTLLSSNPRNCDTIKYFVEWDYFCTNHVYNNITYSISGTTLTMHINYTGGRICAGIIGKKSDTARLVNVPVGTYTVKIDGNVSGTMHPSITLSGKLTVGSCCAVTAEIAGDTSSYCIGDTVKLKSTSKNSTKDRWFVNGALRDSSTTFNYVVSKAGNDTIKLVTDTTTCSDTSFTSFKIMPNPTLINDTSICLNDFVFITAPAGWHKYKWSTGGTGTLVTSRATGTYTLTVTAHSGCEKVDSVKINHVGPLLSLGPDTFFCKGSSVNIGVGSVWNSVRWNYNGVDTSRTKSVDSAGTYIAEVTNSLGCKFTDAINVTSADTVLPVFGSDSACDGKSIKLYVTPGHTNLNWSNGKMTDTITVYSTGSYSATAISSKGCRTTGFGNAKFHDLPNPNLGNDTSICYNHTIRLIAGPPIGNYLWHDGSKLNNFLVDTSGTFYVRVEDANKCVGYDTIMVTSIDCDTVGDTTKDTTIFVPVNFMQESIKFYPNPAREYLIIEELHGNRLSRAAIVDLNGRLVSHVVLSESGTNVINVSHISMGTYILSIELDEGIEVRKKILIE